MRNYIFSLLILITAVSSAQVPASDTTYIRPVGNLFYLVQRSTYDNGSYTESQQIIGDTMALFNRFMSVTDQQAVSKCNDVRYTSGFAKQITTVFREADQVQAMTGMNPIDTMRAKQINLWVGTWNVRGDTSQTITISKTTAGGLRYKVNSGTFKSAQVISNWIIRLNGYPTSGTSTDFYLYEGVKFIQQNGRRWIIKQP